MNTNNVTVVGATGFLGSAICRLLIAENKKVRGLVRSTSDEATVNALKQMGVETIVGDIKGIHSLSEAFKNTDAVISTATATRSRQDGDSLESVDRDGQLNAVKAAADAGVKKFVYISFNPFPGEFPLQTAKRLAEKALTESGMNYTILQPTLFMEVWLSPALGFDFPNHTATIYGSGENKNSWISLSDVATFAVKCVDDAAADNAVIELGGPEALSPLEVVKIFEEKSGKPFTVNKVPQEALQAQKDNAPDTMSSSFASLMLSYAEGGTIDMKDTLQKFPVQLTSVSDYAGRVKQG